MPERCVRRVGARLSKGPSLCLPPGGPLGSARHAAARACIFMHRIPTLRMRASAADRVFLECRGPGHPRLSCLPHGPVAPGGEAGRGSRRREWAEDPGRDARMHPGLEEEPPNGWDADRVPGVPRAIRGRDGRQPGIIQRGADPERRGGAVLGDPDRRDARGCGCPARPASLSRRHAERYGRSGRTLAEPPFGAGSCSLAISIRTRQIGVICARPPGRFRGACPALIWRG